MSDIAKEAGIARATLYRFYTSKEQLYEAQRDLWISVLENKLSAILEKKDLSAEKILELITVAVTHLTDNVLKIPGIKQDFFSDIYGTIKWLEPVYILCQTMLMMVIRQGIDSSEFRAVEVKKVSASLVTLIQLFQLQTIAVHEDMNGYRSKQLDLIRLVIDGMKT